MGRRIVVALGGNAILIDKPSAKEQQKVIMKTCQQLIKLIKNGDSLVISHGNGPQVGNLLLQQQACANGKNPAMPLDTCVAMTQGAIGYWMQQAMQIVCMAEGVDVNVVSLVTQVVVDKNDPSFATPSKPIGPFYTEDEAKMRIENEEGVFKEDAGRGWRKVVASPKPIKIQEAATIKELVRLGVIPISVGGGGIPIVQNGLCLEGCEAVIDKDFASKKLAEEVNADIFLILTGVDHVYIGYNHPEQKRLTNVTVEQMKAYIQENEFAPGSMLPKVEAAIEFVENRPSGVSIITSLENIDALIGGESGTVIRK